MGTLVWIAILVAVAVLIVTVHVLLVLGILPSFPHQLPVAGGSLGAKGDSHAAAADAGVRCDPPRPAMLWPPPARPETTGMITTRLAAPADSSAMAAIYNEG